MNSGKYGTEFITLKYYCYSWESACKIVTSVLYLLVFTSLCSPLSSVLICVTNSTWQEGQYVTTRLPYKRLQLASWTSFSTHYLSLSLGLLVLREASCYDMRIFKELYRNALVARNRGLWQTASEELKPANNYMCELRSKFSSHS